MTGVKNEGKIKRQRRKESMGYVVKERMKNTERGERWMNKRKSGRWFENR